MGKFYYTNHGFWDTLMNFWDEVKNRYFTTERIRIAIMVLFIFGVPIIAKYIKKRNERIQKQQTLQTLKDAAARDLELRNGSSLIDTIKLKELNDIMESINTKMETVE